MTYSNAFLPYTLALVVVACSSNQSVDPGAGDGSAAAAAALSVSYQGRSIAVELGTVAPSSYKGVDLVKLSDAWTSSQIAADHTTLEFEFVGSDGFRPSSKGCVDLAGSVLDQGYIDPTSRNLTWDEGLGMRGCYSVIDTVQMNAHDPTSDAAAP